MDAKNVTTNLLQISSDYTGNITAEVRRAFEPENISRTWTIEHWQFAMGSMLTAATGTKMDTAKTFQVNTMEGPDVTFPPSLMWKYSILTCYIPVSLWTINGERSQQCLSHLTLNIPQ